MTKERCPYNYQTDDGSTRQCVKTAGHDDVHAWTRGAAAQWLPDAPREVRVALAAALLDPGTLRPGDRFRAIWPPHTTHGHTELAEMVPVRPGGRAVVDGRVRARVANGAGGWLRPIYWVTPVERAEP